MRLRSTAGMVFVAIMLMAGGGAGAWEIPLEVREYRGKAGLRYVSGGVPLLPGQAKETAGLTLARRDAAGKLLGVPSQMRVLARWWQKDNSIRWVLVDFQTDIKAGERQEFVLTDARLDTPPSSPGVTVDETGESITVLTGPGRFVVPRKSFTFLKAAAVDGNGDGKFSDDEELLDSAADCGTVVEDCFGQKYCSSEGTGSVEVIEKGPLRVRVRARGVHRAREGKGYDRGMYQYDCFMDFFAGSSTVFADVVVGNNFPKSIGTPTFEDASLWLKLRGGIAGYSIAGDKPHAGKLEAGQSVCLYQDSNGADTWNRCQGYNTEREDYWKFPEGKTASFRGYKLWQRTGGGETAEEAAAGNFARGTTAASNDRGGLVVHMLNFWQQFPKGVEAFSDGRVRLALFPREYKVPHFLEDASGKGHEIVLHFYARGRPGPYGAGPDGRPDTDAVAGVWDGRVYPRPADLSHIAATGALADLGPFTVPTQGLDSKPNNKTAAHDPRMLTDDGLYGNAYGWQVFGERWRSCGGHSTRGARQPMNEDDYLNRWFVTGEPGWLLAGDARSRQFRDVRCYRVEDQDPFGFKDWNDFRARNRSEDWTSREQPKDAEAVKHSAGRYPRSTFWLPNPEHSVLDLVYDRYLLMGDQRSFENLPIIAAHGGYYSAYRPTEVTRATGWSWRTVFRHWELTGQPESEKLLRQTVASYKAMAAGDIKFPMSKDKAGKETVNWWFTFVFSRAAAMTALHTRDPDALHICRRLAEALADIRQKYEGYNSVDFAELHAVLYHLTGQDQYRQEGLGQGGGENLKRVSGNMKSPACAHWLLMQQPRPLKQPG